MLRRGRSSWSLEDDETIIRLKAARETLPRIAAVLGRTDHSVENRWLRLRKERNLPRSRGLKITDHASNFWSKVDQSGGDDACWPWSSRSKNPAGYGVTSFDMGSGWKTYGAHRVAFYLANNRPQTNGLCVLHSCDNPACCNPRHLSEGSHSQNMIEAYARGRRKPNVPSGETHHRALLTEQQVEAVRRLISMGAKRSDVAVLSGVSLGCIDNITSGRNWNAKR